MLNHKNQEIFKEQNKLILNQLIEAEYEVDSLKQILEASSDAILITNPKVEIIYVNPAWERLTGYTLVEVEGKNPKFLKSDKTPHQIYKKLWEHLNNRQSFTHDDLVDRRKDGSEFPAHSTTFPVLKFNTVIYYVQFLYDISEKVEKENERRQILSLISHELKTPITVLKLLISKYSKFSYQVKESDWQSFNKELDRLTQLIDESLDLSRIESNKLNLQPEEFDLNTLIEEVVEQISLTAGMHKIFFSTYPDLKVVADYKRIKQVLINLLTNAVKFSPVEKKVEIYATKKKNQVGMTVKDFGIGIPKEEQALIFDRSYQVQKRASDGLGLGLYISKEIIKKHHGKIWVTSIEGKGSAFSFSLPFNY